MVGIRASHLMLNRAVLPLVAVLCLLVPQIVFASDSHPIPPKIQNLSMGASMGSVMELISGSGAVSSENPKDKQRPKIVWTPAESQHYQSIEFNFTEKNRLFLIRFNVKEGPREVFQGLKKGFFDLYKFQWDEPMRIKVEGNDALVYDRPENSNTYFFEITDRMTGNKSIELMERSISAQDRQKKQPEAARGEPGDEAVPPQTDKKVPDQK